MRVGLAGQEEMEGGVKEEATAEGHKVATGDRVVPVVAVMVG